MRHMLWYFICIWSLLISRFLSLSLSASLSSRLPSLSPSLSLYDWHFHSTRSNSASFLLLSHTHAQTHMHYLSITLSLSLSLSLSHHQTKKIVRNESITMTTNHNKQKVKNSKWNISYTSSRFFALKLSLSLQPIASSNIGRDLTDIKRASLFLTVLPLTKNLLGMAPRGQRVAGTNWSNEKWNTRAHT